MDDSDGFDGNTPEELRGWFESQRKKHGGMLHYIFVNGKIKVVSLMEWVKWMSDFKQRIIDRTDITNLPNYPGGNFVSTVFLGLDHNFDFTEDWKEHTPVLFETMVFGGKYDQHGWRYAGYGEAKQGHWQIVDCIRSGRPPEANTGHRPFIEIFLEMLKNEQSESEPTGNERSSTDPGEPG